ncbi:DUF350 domain-containing protein [Lacinutrix jangbogonensis]|uniref:DUF350 domain-containing protein n=1 Tax=Lacinutrix jangbogonensis TaxID=1469557 RepID=UPI00053F23CA|nr:hypothetical protein [Lacinutrix jangbogonensis]
MELFYLALIQIIISIVLSIIISYKILIKIFRLEESEFNNDNLALSIFFSGIIFSVCYLLSGIIPSIINAIQLIKTHTEESLFLEILKYSAMCLFIAISILQISAFFLIKIMTKHIKEVEQLKKIT